MIEEKPMVAFTGISQSKSFDMVQAAEIAQGSGPMVQQGLGGTSAKNMSKVVHDRPISRNKVNNHEGRCESAMMKEDGDTDWRRPLIEYLQAPNSITSKKT
jgi:hypothetical protein